MNEQTTNNDVYTIKIPSINRRVTSLSPFCEACKNGVVHLSSLGVRKFTQSGKLPNVCKTCNKEFLKVCRSQIRNMSERESLHTCDLCEKTFIHAGNLKKHQGLHQDPQKKLRNLSKVPKKDMNGQTDKLEKIDDTKEDDKPDFLGFENRPCICKECDKEVSNEYAFLKHCQFHVRKNNMSACLTCNQIFENAAEYKAHMLAHEEKCEYICNVCPITFVKISSLKTHCIEKHKKVLQSNEQIPNNFEKPQFQCHICPKTFIQKAAYFRHCELHDSPDSFVCPTCNKVFTTANRLRIHETKHKNVVQNRKKKKIKIKFSCKKCKQNFKTRKTYAKHKKLHR